MNQAVRTACALKAILTAASEIEDWTLQSSRRVGRGRSSRHAVRSDPQFGCNYLEHARVTEPDRRKLACHMALIHD